jgi:hypothetical protein
MTEDGKAEEAWTLAELESQLRDELDGCELVGEIDLERWGQPAERALDEAVTRTDFRPSRSAPATLVTYLCAQGLRADEAGFWPNVSIPVLQESAMVGPQFLQALRRLKLRTFDDLERHEGIGAGGKYVRRIYLHGGLPERSVHSVLNLLQPTLRSTAADAAGVVDSWSVNDLSRYGLAMPAQRLLLYTGDFGLEIIDQLIRLLRAHGRPDRTSAVPAHLQEAFASWTPNEPAEPPRPGPRLEVDRFGDDGPRLRLPRGVDGWLVNGTSVGHSSFAAESLIHLEPQTGWEVSRQDEGRAVRFRSLDDDSGVWIFDSAGRVHRGGLLRGAFAFVVAPSGSQVTGEVERRGLTGPWAAFDLITANTRKHDVLEVLLPDGRDLTPVETDSSWGLRPLGDTIPGVFGPSGQPVVAAQLRVEPEPGWFPTAEDVEVTCDGGEGRATEHLAALQLEDGSFDLSGLLPPRHVARATFTFTAPGTDPYELSVVSVPELDVQLPLLAMPTEQVRVDIACARGIAAPAKVVLDADEAEASFEVRDRRSSVELTVRVERCRWDVVNPSVLVPCFDDERFVVRQDELAGSTLELLCDDSSTFSLWLQDRDGRRRQRVKLRRPQPDSPRWCAQLRIVADTVAHGRDPVHAFVLHGADGRSVELGYVQSGPAADRLRIRTRETTGGTRVDVAWEERRPWPSRQIRVWPLNGDAPVACVDVPEGNCKARLEVPESNGAHLLELASASKWLRPVRPHPSRECRLVFLGPGAQDVIEAIRNVDDRATVTDGDVADLPDLLVHVWLQGIDGRPLTDEQRRVVLALACDSPNRLAGVARLVATARHEGDGLTGEQRLQLLRAAFDCPVRDASPFAIEALDVVWARDPGLAATLDANTDTERWTLLAGWRWEPDEGVGSGLDGLCDLVAASGDVTWQHLRVRGKEYRPPALHPHRWFQLASQRRPELHGPVAAWVEAVPDDPAAFPGRVWRGFYQRLLRLDPVFEAPGVMRSIVGAVCTFLDPVSSEEEADEAAAVLVAASDQLPELTDTCEVFGAAAMRVLQHAPGPRK